MRQSGLSELELPGYQYHLISNTAPADHTPDTTAQPTAIARRKNLTNSPPWLSMCSTES